MGDLDDLDALLEGSPPAPSLRARSPAASTAIAFLGCSRRDGAQLSAARSGCS